MKQTKNILFHYSGSKSEKETASSNAEPIEPGTELHTGTGKGIRSIFKIKDPVSDLINPELNHLTGKKRNV